MFLLRRLAPAARLPGARTVLTAGAQARLAEMRDRHQAVSEELSSDSLSPNDFQRLGKEVARLGPIVDSAGEYERIAAEMSDLEELVAARGESPEASEMAEMAAAELEEAAEQLEEVEASLLRMMVPRDPIDDRNAIVEVRAGTGGQEASLFAEELFSMYGKLAKTHGWQVEQMSFAETDIGGIREASALFKGEGVFGSLKHESGVHRVQRIPVNDVKMQTSAATVAVLPEAEELDIELRTEDLRIDVYRASGAGGQHVNTTESAVRITHIPTGTVVAMQDERSQHQNKRKAMTILRSRVYEEERRRLERERSSMRQGLIGGGDRSEKIRTYHWPQDRVTDHRIGKTIHGVDAVVGGELGEMLEALKERELTERLSEVISGMETGR